MDCNVVPATTPSDAGVAGAGVLLSFIITAGLSLLLSTSLVLQGFSKTGSSDNAMQRPWTTVRRKLLNGYSDQQILTGIGIQALALAQAGSMVAYHVFLIWMLSLLSMATHNATLLATAGDFRRDAVLRWLRQGLMFVNLGLSCTLGVYVLQSTARGLPSTLPVACVWSAGSLPDSGSDSPSTSSAGNTGLAYVGTIVTIAGNCAVFALATWYLNRRGSRMYRLVQLVGLVLMAAIAVGAAVRTLLLSQAFGTPNVPLSDQGERVWSFGQLLSLLMLLLPVVSAVEIFRGEVAVAPPVADDTVPLVDGENQNSPKEG